MLVTSHERIAKIKRKASEKKVDADEYLQDVLTV
jgi:hypothetical protein